MGAIIIFSMVVVVGAMKQASYDIQTDTEDPSLGGDCVKRPWKYAEVRMDKQPQPGHSREVVCVNSDPSIYDHFDSWDFTVDGKDTILAHFKK